MTDDEKKKLKEIVKALKRDFPDWEKSKMYAIATATAKKWWDRRKRWKDPWTDKKPKKFKGMHTDVDLEQIKKWFAENGLDNTIFLKGLFVDTFKQILDKKFC